MTSNVPRIVAGLVNIVLSSLTGLELEGVTTHKASNAPDNE